MPNPNSINTHDELHPHASLPKLPVFLLVTNASEHVVHYLRLKELDRVPRGTGSMLTRLPLALDADEGGLVMVFRERGLEASSVDLSSSGESASGSSSFGILASSDVIDISRCTSRGEDLIIASKLFICGEVAAW